MIQELGRFLKDNLIRIVVGAFIFAIIVVGGRIALSQYHPFKSDEEITPEMVEEAYNDLKKVYEQEPAEFKFIATKEDGDVFGNSYIFDEYLTSDEELKKLEAETGVSLMKWAENERILDLTKNSDFRGGIAGIRDASSGVITMRFQVGHTAEDNLKVAKKAQERLFEKKAPFTEKLELSLIEAPQNYEWIPKEQITYVSTPDTLSLYAGTSTRSVIKYGIIGFVCGLILSTALAFIIQLYKEKITYGFDYAWDIDQYHMMVPLDQFNSQGQVQNFLNIPEVAQRVIISQSNPENRVTDLVMPNGSSRIFVNQIQNLQELNDVEANPDEIVVLIFSRQTSKQWYREQMALAKMFNTSVKIIHMY